MASSSSTEWPAGRRRAPTKGDRSEQALLDALERLLAEHPISRVSVDRIARAAGLTRTAFYFHFASKEAALRRLVERAVAAIWEVPDSWLLDRGDPHEGLERGLAAVAEAWSTHGAVFAAVAEAAAHDAEVWAFWHGQLETFIDAVARRIEADRARGLTREGVDPRPLAEALCWMNERYLYVHLAREDDRRSQDEVQRVLLDVWRRAIYGESISSGR
jgi:TetR/AcrR family transcriptional regulator, ethionamide resistance regulator